MRTRLLVSVAALAAALLAPSAALAAGRAGHHVSGNADVRDERGAELSTWLDVPDASSAITSGGPTADCAANPELFTAPTGRRRSPVGVHGVHGQRARCRRDGHVLLPSSRRRPDVDRHRHDGVRHDGARGSRHRRRPRHDQRATSTARTPTVASSGFEVDARPRRCAVAGALGRDVLDAGHALRRVDDPRGVSLPRDLERSTSCHGRSTSTAPADARLHGPTAFDRRRVLERRVLRRPRRLATDRADQHAPDTATNMPVTVRQTRRPTAADASGGRDNTAPTVARGRLASCAATRVASVGRLGASGVRVELRGTGWARVGRATPIGSDAAARTSVSWDYDRRRSRTGSTTCARSRPTARRATTSPTITGVRVDNTPPTVSVTAPAGGRWCAGRASLVSASALGRRRLGCDGCELRYRSSSVRARGRRSARTDRQPVLGPVVDTTTAIAGRCSTTCARSRPTSGHARDDLDRVTGVRVDNTLPTVTLGGVTGSTSVHGSLVADWRRPTGGSGVPSVHVRPTGRARAAATRRSARPTRRSPYGPSRSTRRAWPTATTSSRRSRPTSPGNTSRARRRRACCIDNTPPTAPAQPTGLTPVSAAPTITFGAATDPLSGGVASGVDHYDVYRDGVADQRRADRRHRRRPVHLERRRGPVDQPGRGPEHRTPTGSSRSTRRATSPRVSPAHVISSTRRRLSAAGLGRRARDADQPAPAGLLGRAGRAGFTLDHYNVYRGGSSRSASSPRRPRRSPTSAGLADGTYTYQVVAASVPATPRSASPPRAVTVALRHDARPRRPAASPRRRRWTARSASAGRRRATAPARASRATSCAGRCPSSAPVSVADGDATCQGLFDLVRGRDGAQRQALQLRGVRGRRRRQHLGGRRLRGRDRTRPARARRLRRASRRRRATRSVDLRWTRRRGRRRRRRLRARGQAGRRGAGQRGRRHARLHRDRRRLDGVLGDRADERRDLHVRALRARRGAQPLAGRRRQRGAERQGDRREGAGRRHEAQGQGLGDARSR